MRSIFHKLHIFLIALVGEVIKLHYRMFPWHGGSGLNSSSRKGKRLVVSLTSYGRRVDTVLPFTIISLLRQTYKPDVLVLWLDSDHWDDDNLPPCLRRLTDYGLTIRYCEDIKSYKKLIPTLKEYPNDIIITCDDDVFYRKDMIEKLVLAYQKDSSCVYTHLAHKITFSANGFLNSYNDWDMDVSEMKGHLIFPTGVGGCLYNRSLLHPDICREDLFLRLAPNADDVWFYFMERLLGTQCEVLSHQGRICIPLDALYQYFHKGASLSSSNCKESQNDVQIRAVMEHYGLQSKNLI